MKRCRLKRYNFQIRNKMSKENKTSDKHENGNDFIADVSRCGLTEIEYTERERLLELQRSRTRWFSQEEFERLKELSTKMYKNAGSPHCG